MGAFWVETRHCCNTGTTAALNRRFIYRSHSSRSRQDVEASSPMTARLVWNNPYFPSVERPRAKRPWPSVMAIVSSLKADRGNGNPPMSSILTIDGRGHTPSCPLYKKSVPRADEKSSHVDLFCGCHSWREPRILPNGTNIAWPAGWTQSEARTWRVKYGLAAPVAG